jgi:hypothetical protein
MSNVVQLVPRPALQVTELCGYGERAYFGGDHCQHCADRDEQLRLKRIRDQGRRFIERRRGSRARHG